MTRANEAKAGCSTSHRDPSWGWSHGRFGGLVAPLLGRAVGRPQEPKAGPPSRPASPGPARAARYPHRAHVRRPGCRATITAVADAGSDAPVDEFGASR